MGRPFSVDDVNKEGMKLGHEENVFINYGVKISPQQIKLSA
jgi:hypothetical protein